MMNMQEEKPHVLVADDDPLNLLLLERFLQNDFRLSFVSNGVEVLEMLKHDQSVDLLLLDGMMPYMDGLTALANIRQNPATSDLPVIMVSAMSDQEDIVRGLQAGANDYIAKPYQPDIVLARVHTQATLKRLQDDRKRTIAELQYANQMKDHFLRIASHDLQAPLSNIRMAHYMLRDTVGTIGDAQVLLDTIDTTVDTMQAVIEEFLDSAALQVGKVDLDIQATPINDILWEMAMQFNAHAERKNTSINVIDTKASIYIDARRLKQVLSNFVSNAIKYSPHGSEVHIWADELGATTRICVADQGPGIPDNERSKLFTQFGKLTHRPTGGESSTGLGLWIARYLTEIQNGTIGVDCPADGGSIFWVEFPAA